MAISVNHMKLPQAPPSDNQFTLLARAGREVVFLTLSLSLSLLRARYSGADDGKLSFEVQVQMIQLTTSLDQEGIKRALRRVLERIP